MASLDAIMGATATLLTGAGVVPRAYPHPVDVLDPICAVVAYPAIEFDSVMARGADTIQLPVYIVAGRTTEQSARTAISAIVDGAAGVKQVLDGNLAGVVDTSRVTSMRVVKITVSDIEYLAALFNVEVVH